MTKANNIVGYLRLSKERFFMVEKGVNAFTISKNLDFIYGNENLQLLRLDTKCLNKKYIKILFLKLHFKLFIISLLYFFIFYYPSIIHIKYFITK